MKKRFAPIILYVLVFTLLVYNPYTTYVSLDVIIMAIAYCISLGCLYSQTKFASLIYYILNYSSIFYMISSKGLSYNDSIYMITLSLCFVLAVLITFFKDTSDLIFIISLVVAFVILYSNPIKSLYNLDLNSNISSLLFFVSCINLIGYDMEDNYLKRKPSKIFKRRTRKSKG